MIRKIYRYIFDDEKNSEEEVAAVDSSHTLMTHCHPAALITYYLLPLSFARISLPPACICLASCCLRAWHGRQPLRDAPCQFFFSFLPFESLPMYQVFCIVLLLVRVITCLCLPSAKKCHSFTASPF